MTLPLNSLFNPPKPDASPQEVTRYLAGQLARLSLKSMVHLDATLAASPEKQHTTLKALEKSYLLHLQQEQNHD